MLVLHSHYCKATAIDTQHDVHRIDADTLRTPSVTDSVGPGFRSLPTEYHDYHPTVEGSIPDWLSGTLIRNGPALFEAGDRRVNHWFDGLAMLRRYAFDDGDLSYSNRFLRTEAYADAQAGRLTGQFGTDTRGWRRSARRSRGGWDSPTRLTTPTITSPGSTANSSRSPRPRGGSPSIPRRSTLTASSSLLTTCRNTSPPPIWSMTLTARSWLGSPPSSARRHSTTSIGFPQEAASERRLLRSTLAVRPTSTTAASPRIT